MKLSVTTFVGRIVRDPLHSHRLHLSQNYYSKNDKMIHYFLMISYCVHNKCHQNTLFWRKNENADLDG